MDEGNDKVKACIYATLLSSRMRNGAKREHRTGEEVSYAGFQPVSCLGLCHEE
jgi:hypothetical protein